MSLLRILAAVILVGIGACNNDQVTTQHGDYSAITVTDYSGSSIGLEKPAKRIVALAPHIVENVFSAGAGNYLVGVIEHSDFPEQALDLEIVGSFETINYEKLLQLNPDLIVAWQSGGSHSSIQKLQELGFNVYVDQPENLQDIAKSILDISTLAGTNDVAKPVVESYLLEIETIFSNQQNKPPVTAFYQVWHQPLQTINGTHLISSALEICGGVNIFADEFAVAPIVNIESILERNPDTIIASGNANNQSALIEQWMQWPSLSAVKNQHIFNIDPDHIQRHSLRILLGIQAFCAHFDQVRRSKQ